MTNDDSARCTVQNYPDSSPDSNLVTQIRPPIYIRSYLHTHNSPPHIAPSPTPFPFPTPTSPPCQDPSHMRLVKAEVVVEATADDVFEVYMGGNVSQRLQ